MNYDNGSRFIIRFKPTVFLKDYSVAGCAYTTLLREAKQFRLRDDAAAVARLMSGDVARVVIIDGEVKSALMQDSTTPVATHYSFEDLLPQLETL